MLEKASGSNSASTEFIWMIKAKNAYFQCERKKSTVALKKVVLLQMLIAMIDGRP